VADQDDHQGELYYREFIARMQEHGPERLGLMSSWAWIDDPKRLTFTLARYKFVAKMLEGAEHVLEVGCADGFGTRVVSQAVGKVTAVDFDPAFIASAKSVAHERFPIEFKFHDMLHGPVEGTFAGVYSLDVLEHIEPAREESFLANMIAPLVAHGVCIVGMPSLESQNYASKFSKLGHVNCKEQPQLKNLMQKFFQNVFMFSMNDELIHTGYSKMSHYNLALCCGKKAA
jgi:cyclopropane fatty-acyl-phospholipid synthase-like methyltransferase